MGLHRAAILLTIAILLAACASSSAGPLTSSTVPTGSGSGSGSDALRSPGFAGAVARPSTAAVDASPSAASFTSPPSAPVPSPAAAASSGQAGGAFSFDLYRPGIYSMQATWWWCTAAGVQMLRNILLGRADHSAAAQGRYFDYMRARNAYRMPAHEGVDLAGLLAGVRHLVDPTYGRVASQTYDAAITGAVRRLRLTGRPVVLIVMGGRHLWLMTGFTATADPATDPAFRVLSVKIVGPLYGRQSLDGYDPPPDTTLSYRALRKYLLPYHFKFGPTPWDRRYVTYTG